MHTLYLFSVWLHIIAAIVWIGGMVFLALVVVPVLRRPEHRRIMVALMSETGKRFRVVGWVCLGTLLLTGVANLTSHGVRWVDIGSGQFFVGDFGHTLGGKLVLVGLVLVLSVLHDFFIGPRATEVGRTAPGSADALRLRRQASWLGRINLLLALMIVVLAVVLVRG